MREIVYAIDELLDCNNEDEWYDTNISSHTIKLVQQTNLSELEQLYSLVGQKSDSWRIHFAEVLAELNHSNATMILLSLLKDYDDTMLIYICSQSLKKHLRQLTKDDIITIINRLSFTMKANCMSGYVYMATQMIDFYKNIY